MKYQIGDKFVNNNENIKITYVGIRGYNCSQGISLAGLPTIMSYISYSEDYLNNLCKNGWTYIPKQPSNPPVTILGTNSGWVPGTILGVPPVNYSSNLLPVLPFKNAFSDIDLTTNVLDSMNNECSHSLYEEKVLFTSWYKICLNCKKEFE